MPECIQRSVEGGKVTNTPIDCILCEEPQPLLKTGFLSVVNKRHARQCVSEHCKCILTFAEFLLCSSIPGILVVVGDKIHLHSIFRVNGIDLLLQFNDGLNSVLAFGNLCHHTMHVPAVIHIEGSLAHIFSAFIFGKHKQRFGLLKFGAGLFPEFHRHFAGDIAAEAIDITLVDPVFHGFDHGFAHLLVFVIQFRHIGPVKSRKDLARTVLCIPIGMLSNPFVIPCGMICNPVDDNFDAHTMCFCHKRLKISLCSEFRVHTFIVAHGIVTAKAACASCREFAV